MRRAPSFELRQKVCAALNGTYYAAIILEIGLSTECEEYMYYVQFVEQDSRMDCWLPAGKLREWPQGRIVQPKQALIGEGVTTRGQNRLAASKITTNPWDGKVNTSTSSSCAVGTTSSAGQLLSPAKRGSAQHGPIHSQRARKDSSFFSRIKNIQTICIGSYKVNTWYFSPYHLARPSVIRRLTQNAQYIPENAELQLTQGDANGTGQRPAYPIAANFTLHLCPYCLQPFSDHDGVIRHLQALCQRHPPGNEIYRDSVRRISVFELDGKVEPIFCEQLALLSKLFLEHKALDHDMTPFLFYVLCSIESHGLQVLGYFSKEKQSPEAYNLSCILVLPQFQSRGIGRFLIELSYELSKREGKIGTPEKPLSDLGEKLYMGYWSDTILCALARALEESHCITINYLVQATSMLHADVIRTLQYLKLLNGTQLCISGESIERAFSKRLLREKNIRCYTFYTHLLSWSPAMYEEIKRELYPAEYVMWGEKNESTESPVGKKSLSDG